MTDSQDTQPRVASEEAADPLAWPVDNRDIDHPTAAVREEQPTLSPIPTARRKAKTSDVMLEDEQLGALLRQHPNRIVNFALQQEVRGISLADIMSNPPTRRILNRLIKDTDEGNDENQNNNTPETRDTQFHSVNAISAVQTNHLVLVGQVNTAAKHEVIGYGDTFNEHEQLKNQQMVRMEDKISGVVLIQGDLPECWAEIYDCRARCLIDSGSMMNVMRLSAANAMGLVVDNSAGADGPGGLVTANGSVDPYVGVAIDVPIKVNYIRSTMVFRIQITDVMDYKWSMQM
ncbi:hypothetical protein BU24DRAFT_459911 [Aaosphaeria arxii CBS 175.79]|uniref:Uncharacterized protein n=1 Tax=Aaosphaeria arxii CBS 175.79 TaxID=1450172 RepID=A0A6A5Y4X8_9PLEO|nr:uncharacterized protein BU24DRAFT_459911 [Aaosphaeria arxii CBS 175.79]KAF2020319.1 hypothetical protein BU24DRAFT_459911 [Aaosphaeria arxii CBS 175.79]